MIADAPPQPASAPRQADRSPTGAGSDGDAAHLLADGLRHHRAGRIVEAEAAYRLILRHEPHHVRALHLLGLTAHQSGKYTVAAAFISKALSLAPDDPALLRNLGNALHEQGRLGEAAVQYERALAIKPGFAAAHNDLANTRLAQGYPHKAVAQYRQALMSKPDAAATHSNLLFAMHYADTYSRATLAREARRWAARHATHLRPSRPAYSNTPDPTRRLHVGLVSADFRMHSVAYLLAPFLAALDRDQFSVTCYSNDWRTDPMTARLQGLADRWRSVVGTSDDDMAARVRDDSIDILVDLSGHTAGNRLPVFARRPAPVSMTWMGYSDTTGLGAIDHLLADPVVCPPAHDGEYAEQVLRLPDTYISYEPLGIAPDVSTDHIGNGPPVFGCFNNLAKITPRVVALWAAILKRVPDATILLKTASLDDPATSARYRRLFRVHGLPDARVSLVGKTRQSAVLGYYNTVHVALDPFPYNGTVTTLEALWMGVPVVTLRGDRFVARVGESLLRSVDLPDLVAPTPEAYVDTAVAVAQDRARLTALRHELRTRMSAGPLGDHARFARHVERAWREAWASWCATQPRRLCSGA